MTTPEDVEQLSVDACWSLLRTTSLGRMAVWMEDHPDIFPLNFVVDQGTVVFRTGEGSKVLGALSGTPVALEADGYDPATSQAWSVVVKGPARTISEVHDVMDTVDLPLFPWQGGDKSRFVRIVPGVVTGRRFTVVDSSTWQTLPSHLRRAPQE